jgi:hypothetical protein
VSVPFYFGVEAYCTRVPLTSCTLLHLDLQQLIPKQRVLQGWRITYIIVILAYYCYAEITAEVTTGRSGYTASWWHHHCTRKSSKRGRRPGHLGSALPAVVTLSFITGVGTTSSLLGSWRAHTLLFNTWNYPARCRHSDRHKPLSKLFRLSIPCLPERVPTIHTYVAEARLNVI